MHGHAKQVMAIATLLQHRTGRMVLGKQGLLVGHPCVQGLAFFGVRVKEDAHDRDRNGHNKNEFKWPHMPIKIGPIEPNLLHLPFIRDTRLRRHSGLDHDLQIF
jgi:hypothetical protein